MAHNHQQSDWYTPVLNTTYHEMEEYYNTTIIPARIRRPKDKANAEGSVGNISAWITAALRNPQFFLLTEINSAIRDKLNVFNATLFQEKEVSKAQSISWKKKSLLAALHATPFELCERKQATV